MKLSVKYKIGLLVLYYIVLIVSIVFKFFKKEYLNIEFVNEYNNYKLFYFYVLNKEYYIQIILNILSFIPLGFLLVYNIKKYSGVICGVLILLSSLSFEIVQLEFELGVFDINDIVFNFVGGIIGVLTYCLLSKNKIVK